VEEAGALRGTCDVQVQLDIRRYKKSDQDSSGKRARHVRARRTSATMHVRTLVRSMDGWMDGWIFFFDRKLALY
jgi:hypothetical protein